MDNDNKWDYIYNPATNGISKFSRKETANSLVWMILVTVLAAVASGVIVFIFLKNKKFIVQHIIYKERDSEREKEGQQESYSEMKPIIREFEEAKFQMSEEQVVDDKTKFLEEIRRDIENITIKSDEEETTQDIEKRVDEIIDSKYIDILIKS